MSPKEDLSPTQCYHNCTEWGREIRWDTTSQYVNKRGGEVTDLGTLKVSNEKNLITITNRYNFIFYHNDKKHERNVPSLSKLVCFIQTHTNMFRFTQLLQGIQVCCSKCYRQQKKTRMNTHVDCLTETHPSNYRDILSMQIFRNKSIYLTGINRCRCERKWRAF